MIICRDIATFQAGMGDKVATFIQWVSTFIVGAIICLVRGWKLTLVILSVAPVAVIAGSIVARVYFSACLIFMICLMCMFFNNAI